MQNNNRRTTPRGVRSLFEEMLAGQMAGGAGAPATRGAGRQPESEAPPPTEGLYIISVAARILSMHPQTLRKYERVGLVRPSRTMGMLRLYSEEDITKLRVIKRLVVELHLNLAGVEMAMAVFDRLIRARFEIGARPTSTMRAFERMVDQIMELFQGPSDAPANRGRRAR